MRVMLAGQMARDDALAERLLPECQLFVVAPDVNPGLLAKVDASHGSYYQVPSITSVHEIAEAAADAKAELFISHSDDALAADVAGVVKTRLPEILVASPDRAASQGEWDKEYLRELVVEIDNTYNPAYVSVSEPEDTHQALERFIEFGMEVAVKPRNLTGGKGVKVMGEHLKNYEEVEAYAQQVLADPNQEGLLFEEKLTGPEFTIQGLTDGKTLIRPPVTYDYPYREDGDIGPGTGGMGSFTMADGLMPFLEQTEYNEALNLLERILEKFDKRKLNFKGVMYGSFFKTSKGLKLTEINARGGDPELVNVMDLLDDGVSALEVFTKIATGDLTPQAVRYKRISSVVLYLVSPDYAYKDHGTCEFNFNAEGAVYYGCKTWFSGARKRGPNSYTAGPSRALAISSLAPTPWEARDKIIESITASLHGRLDYRREVGEQSYVANLRA